MADKTVTKGSVKKSQGRTDSKSQHDLVEVKIVKNGNFYKKGDVDKVHPATAEILKEKGLI